MQDRIRNQFIRDEEGRAWQHAARIAMASFDAIPEHRAALSAADKSGRRGRRRSTFLLPVLRRLPFLKRAPHGWWILPALVVSGAMWVGILRILRMIFGGA